MFPCSSLYTPFIKLFVCYCCVLLIVNVKGALAQVVGHRYVIYGVYRFVKFCTEQFHIRFGRMQELHGYQRREGIYVHYWEPPFRNLSLCRVHQAP